MRIAGPRTNFRVVIDPRPANYIASADKNMQYACEEIVAAVKRHIDLVANIHWDCEKPMVCSHCGRPWTEESDTYNGGCCGPDEENAPQLEASQ